MRTIQPGDRVFIYYDFRRQWMRTVEQDKDFHCDKGYMHFNDLIGHPYGHTYRLYPNNHKVAILPPLMSDIIFQMKRQSQIIYPEDIGAILFYAFVTPGNHILEAGTGSGTVTGILAHYCRPHGHVQSFDVREQALSQAQKNVANMGVADSVTIQLGDILEEDFDITDLDFVMLDLATTWDALPRVCPYLAPDHGKVCLFSPTLEQVKKNVYAMKKAGFSVVQTIELVKRFYQVKPNATRPLGRTVGHTGYMTFGALDSFHFEQRGFDELYSPENLGNLIIYAHLTAESPAVVVTSEASPLRKIFDQFFKGNAHIHYITLRDPSSAGDEMSGLDQIEGGSFAVALLDNVEPGQWVSALDPKLQPGGVFCAINDNIEAAKAFHLGLKGLQFYDLSTSELIKRQVVVDEARNATKSSVFPNQGYLSFGRRVIDNIEFKQGKPPRGEKAELVLDVGLGV